MKIHLIFQFNGTEKMGIQTTKQDPKRTHAGCKPAGDLNKVYQKQIDVRNQSNECPLLIWK